MEPGLVADRKRQFRQSGGAEGLGSAETELGVVWTWLATIVPVWTLTSAAITTVAPEIVARSAV